MVEIAYQRIFVICVQSCAFIPAKLCARAAYAVAVVANAQLLNPCGDCRFDYGFGLVLTAERIIGVCV